MTELKTMQFWIIGCTEWSLAVLCAPENLKTLISNTSVEKKGGWGWGVHVLA